jgi:hypothetical protein
MQAYILARENPNLKDLASRIHTLYFLATPHQGSGLAKILGNILRVTCGAKSFVMDLDRNSESIATTNDSFRHYAEYLQLWSFYETVPSDLGLMKAIIVDKASASLGYSKEWPLPLDADHCSICRFDQQTDGNYRKLFNVFTTTIDTILSEGKTTPFKKMSRSLLISSSFPSYLRNFETSASSAR